MNLAKNEAFTLNPIDLIEGIFAKKEFAIERRKQNEVAIEVEGRWNNMVLFFAHEETMNCLHLSCLIDVKTEISDLSKVFELLALINENLWVGHFSYWNEEKMPVYKHSLILNGHNEGLANKISQLIDIAIKECERMYPVFNVVLKKGMDPKRAMYPITTETIGEA